MPLSYHCSECNIKACLKGGDYSDHCPSLESIVVQEAIETAASDDYARQVMLVAAKITHDEQGAVRSRMQETIAFCKEMKLKVVGVAFCVALAKEARVFCNELSKAGFTVIPVCCKVGRVGLYDLGIEMACKSKTGSCNPVTQAALMNKNHTELNIVMGLCVGHDILFAKHSNSPMTTLVVKDRVYHHNPVAAMHEPDKA